jgi:putative addiction module CopG family antidote
MNVSLTPKLEAFVRSKVAGGLYNNASEVVREALRLLVERESNAPMRDLAPAATEVAAGVLRSKRQLLAMGVRSVALFGSVLKGEAGPDSDIDLLIDIDPSRGLSLVNLSEIGDFLENELKRPVDLVTRKGLDPAIRQRVLNEAQTIF